MKKISEKLKTQRFVPKSHGVLCSLPHLFLVERDEAVEGPAQCERHGGPVEHLVRQAPLEVHRHAVGLLQSGEQQAQ